MNPLTPNTVLKAFLFAALALVLAAPAAARPILDVDEPAFAGRTITAGELISTELGYPVYRSSGQEQPDLLKAIAGRTITAGELISTEQGYPVYRSSGQEQPDWLKALNARSQAMNEFYGAGTSPARPDDRPTPRPTVTGTVGGGAEDDGGIAFGDAALFALGGFGVALMVGIGGLILVNSARKPTTPAH
jgi:hypothetical protein